MDELNNRIKEYEELFQNDTIRPIIDSLYENKIGLPFLNKISKKYLRKGKRGILIIYHQAMKMQE